MPIAATWKDPEIIILSEVSQTQEDKCHMQSLLWNLKYNKENLFINQKQTHRDRKQIYGYQWVRWGGHKLGFGI